MRRRRPSVDIFPAALRTTALASALAAVSLFPAPVGGSSGSSGKWVTVELSSTTAATWTPPVYPTMLFVDATAAGGAGGGKAATTARGGGGGGAGEHCLGRPMWINDGTALDYICGTGGTGVSGAAGNAGGPTYFGRFTSSSYDGPGLIYCIGGAGGAVISVSDGGIGGGNIPFPAATSVGQTAHAVRQQLHWFAGAGGACGGESSAQNSGLPGQAELGGVAAIGAAANGSGGGGPGAGSPWGPGAAGTAGVAGSTNGTNAPSTSWGAGGSGANGADFNNKTGGNGANGRIWVVYWDPNGDTTHGWIYEKLGGTAGAASGTFTTPADVAATIWLYGTAPGGSAGSRSATTNSSGSAGSGEYCLGLPYPYSAGGVAYSIPGETAAAASGDNDGTTGTDLTFGWVVLKGGVRGTRAGNRAGGSGGGRLPNGTGAGGGTSGGAGSPYGPVAGGISSSTTGVYCNSGSGGGGGNTGATAGGTGGRIECSRSADGGAAGAGAGGSGGGCSWMGNGGLGQAYDAGSGHDGPNAEAPGAGGGGCYGASSARVGGKGGPGCMIAMHWVEYA